MVNPGTKKTRLIIQLSTLSAEDENGALGDRFRRKTTSAVTERGSTRQWPP